MLKIYFQKSERETDKKPNPIREQIPTLILILMCTFQRKTIGRNENEKSQHADVTRLEDQLELLANFSIQVEDHLLGIFQLPFGCRETSSYQARWDPRAS